jgi:hypothetical protein
VIRPDRRRAGDDVCGKCRWTEETHPGGDTDVGDEYRQQWLAETMARFTP